MIRKYNKNSDYKLLAKWWVEHSMYPPPIDFLPENGYIISNKMAVFICKTDSKFAILEFFISDPNSTKEERAVLSDLLLLHVMDECKEMGYLQIQNFLEHPGSSTTLERNGFKLHSNSVKFYSKELL